MDNHDPGSCLRKAWDIKPQPTVDVGGSVGETRYQVFDLGALLGKLPGRLGPGMQMLGRNQADGTGPQQMRKHNSPQGMHRIAQRYSKFVSHDNSIVPESL